MFAHKLLSLLSLSLSLSLPLLLLLPALVLPQSHALHLPPLLPLFPRTASRLQNSTAFTGESCSNANASICAFPRRCLRVSPIFQPCSIHDTHCVCSAPVLLPCASSQVCWPGDLCVRVPAVPQPLCLSCNLLHHSNLALTPVDHNYTSLCPIGPSQSLAPFPSSTPVPSSTPDTDLDPLDPSPEQSEQPQLPDPGFTGDECFSFNPDICVAPRQCLNFDFNPCTPSDVCLCLESSLRSCNSSAECLPGDVCVTDSIPDTAICVSCNLFHVIQDSWVRVDDLPVCPASLPTPTFPPESPSSFPTPSQSVGTGATGDLCEVSNPDFCVPTRECVSIVEGFPPCSASDFNCICLDENNIICTSSSDCLRGDRCVSDGNASICYSCQLFETLTAPIVNVDDSMGNCPFSPPSGSPVPPSDEDDGTGGATGETCVPTNPDMCESPRKCRNGSGSLCEKTDTMCICVEETLSFCESSLDCLVLDRCVRLDGVEDNICLSCELVEGSFGVDFVDDGLGRCNATFLERTSTGKALS